MNDGDHADDDDDDQKVDADTRLKWSHSMTLKIDWESVMNIINSIVSYFSCPMMMIVHQLHCVPHVHGCPVIESRREKRKIPYSTWIRKNSLHEGEDHELETFFEIPSLHS